MCSSVCALLFVCCSVQVGEGYTSTVWLEEGLCYTPQMTTHRLMGIYSPFSRTVTSLLTCIRDTAFPTALSVSDSCSSSSVRWFSWLLSCALMASRDSSGQLAFLSVWLSRWISCSSWAERTEKSWSRRPQSSSLPWSSPSFFLIPRSLSTSAWSSSSQYCSWASSAWFLRTSSSKVSISSCKWASETGDGHGDG